MANHSVRVEQQAIEKVKQALDRQNLQQELLPQMTGLDASTLARFFRGQSVDFEAIAAIYSALDLTWEEGDTVALFHKSSANGSINLEILAARARERCCEKIERAYGRFPLINGRRVATERIPSHVYTIEKLPRESYISIPDLLEQFNSSRNFDRFGLGDRQGRIPGVDAANLCDKLLVLGKPGAGKSAFLQYLAIACCKGEFQGDRIPLLLELKSLTPEDSASPSFVQDWVERELALGDRARAEALLHHGKVLILCDDLDAMPKTARRNLQYQIRIFSQRYFKNRFVLSSKTQITEFTFPAFECVEIAEFSPKQIKRFAEIWFAEVGELQYHAEALARQFCRQLRKPENWRIAELAGDPFCLSLLAWIFSLNYAIPAYPCDLYEQGLALLWSKEESNLEDRFALLSYLALRTLDREELFFTRDTVLDDLALALRAVAPPQTARRQLQESALGWLDIFEGRDRAIVERTHGIYSFASVELHSYFVGRALTAHLDRQHFEQTFSRSTPKIWCDAFFDALNRFPRADDLLLHLKRKTDEMIADDPKLQLFLAWVNQKAASVTTSYKPTAVRAFYLSLGIDRDLEPKLAHPLDFSHAVDRAIKSPLHNRALACWLDANIAIAFQHDPLRHLDPELALDLILDCLLVTLTHNLDLFLTFLEARQLALEEDFHRSLQELNAQLPDASQDRLQAQKWWESHRRDWTENLRLAIIGYRNIGYTWQLDSHQQKLLKQYLSTNKFLVEGLNRATNVSPQVQQTLEETLLLPIAGADES